MKKFIPLLAIIVLFTGCQRHSLWGGVELTGIEKVDLLLLHNEARKLPLEMDLDCDIAAQNQADWMATTGKMVHVRPLGYPERSVTDRLKKKWTVVGENIAMGQETPTEVMDDWMDSPGHKRNIQNSSFHHVGFGVATDKNDRKYWCTVFSD